TLGAAVTMLLVTALGVVGVQQALNGTADVLEELPQAVQKLRYAVSSWERDGRGPLKQVRKTADELKKLADGTAAPAAAPVAAPASTRTTATASATESKTIVVAGTMGMAI